MGSKIQNSDRYEKSSAFERFLEYSNEKQVILDSIVGTFNPKKDWAFLDVGAGNGDLTIQLSRHFSKTTVVEPSALMIESLKKRVSSMNNFEILQSKIETQKLDGNFDLILLSHVLYFVNDWKKLFKKLIFHLNDGGYLVVIMHARSGSFRNFLLKFQKMIDSKIKMPNYSHCLNILRQMNLKPKSKIIKSKIIISDKDEAFNLCEFFFEVPLNKIKPPVKEKLYKYFNSHKQGKNVVLNANHGLVWIKK